MLIKSDLIPCDLDKAKKHLYKFLNKDDSRVLFLYAKILNSCEIADTDKTEIATYYKITAENGEKKFICIMQIFYKKVNYSQIMNLAIFHINLSQMKNMFKN